MFLEDIEILFEKLSYCEHNHSSFDRSKYDILEQCARKS